jgi:hypothetical protein
MLQFPNLRFADPIFLRFVDLRFADLGFADLRFANQIIFAELRLPQIRKNIIFVLTNISKNFSHLNLSTVLAFSTVLRQF